MFDYKYNRTLSSEKYNAAIAVNNDDIYKIFPSANELKKMQLEQEKQKVLWELYTKLSKTRCCPVKYDGIIPDGCIDFLQGKGYTVFQKREPITLQGGTGKFYYEIYF